MKYPYESTLDISQTNLYNIKNEINMHKEIILDQENVTNNYEPDIENASCNVKHDECPSITVLMPVYNAGQYIKEAIDSVLSQTFKDFEFLILNDGSIDNSNEIIQEYKDERIRYEVFQHDFLTTLNNGIDLSKGKYIARMDADDIMMPDRLAVQFDFMEKHSDIVACGSYISFIENEQNILERPISPNEVFESLMLFCPIANPSSMIRRKVIIDHHIRYNPNYLYAEDYKFWTELAKYGKIANIPLVLLKYRISAVQVSLTHRNQQAELSEKISREMISYCLSKIKINDNTLIERVVTELIPYLEQLLNNSKLSYEKYSQFMYSLVCGLREQRYISI